MIWCRRRKPPRDTDGAMSDARPRILILGANFAGLTTARYVAEKVGDRSRITGIDRKPYLTFIPNIPLEMW